MNKKILLVGGTGFIGKHLSILLYQHGIPFSITSRNPDRHYVRNTVPGVDVFPREILDNNFSELIHQFSHVVYLAAETSAGAQPESIIQSIGLQAISHLHFFESAYRAHPEIKITFLSSGGTVYGDGFSAPIPESSQTAPISPYGYSKLSLENGLRFLGRYFRARFAIIRPANPVGKWQQSSVQGIIAHAIRAYLSHAPLWIFGAGDHVRDYFDVDALADAIIRIAFDEDHENEIWNVGSGKGLTINQVVHLVEKVAGGHIEKQYRPARKTDVHYNVLDIKKVKKIFGWSPSREMDEVVGEMIEYQRCV